jgi:hypothetical protein
VAVALPTVAVDLTAAVGLAAAVQQLRLALRLLVLPTLEVVVEDQTELPLQVVRALSLFDTQFKENNHGAFCKD